MVVHVAYHEEQYESAAECIAAMRARVGSGWDVAWISGPHEAAYVVRYRRESRLQALISVEV